MDRVTMNNLASVRRHNPRALVVTMSAGEKMDGGYALDATPHIKKFHSANPQKSSDWLVCSWFVQKKESCEKWWIIEWDTFCNVSVEDYYQPVWRFPFVASTVVYPNREPSWPWFKATGKIPEEYQPHARGAAPFLFLISEEALLPICRSLLEKPILHGNGEFRFGTVATKCGFAPCAYSPPNDRITWLTWKGPVTEKTVFHPVKHFHEVR